MSPSTRDAWTIQPQARKLLYGSMVCIDHRQTKVCSASSTAQLDLLWRYITAWVFIVFSVTRCRSLLAVCACV